MFFGLEIVFWCFDVVLSEGFLYHQLSLRELQSTKLQPFTPFNKDQMWLYLFPLMSEDIFLIISDDLEKSFQSMLSTKLSIDYWCLGIFAIMSSKMFCGVHLFVTDKSDHLVQSNIACILLALGRFEESLQPANKACELQPDWPKVCLLIIFYYSVTTGLQFCTF